MFVICDGMPRSASTWSFNVVMGLLRRSRPTAEVHGGFDEVTARFVEAAPPGTAHLVMKCHTLDVLALGLIESGSAKAIYTRRDPAEAVESAMWLFGLDFDEASRAIETSLDLLRYHRESDSALVLDYEDIVSEPAESAGRVASYLGLERKKSLIGRVVSETSIGEVRARLALLETPEGKSKLRAYGGMSFDPETLLHPNHMREGDPRDRPVNLKPSQLARLKKLRSGYDTPQPSGTGHRARGIRPRHSTAHFGALQEAHRVQAEAARERLARLEELSADRDGLAAAAAERLQALEDLASARDETVEELRVSIERLERERAVQTRSSEERLAALEALEAEHERLVAIAAERLRMLDEVAADRDALAATAAERLDALEKLTVARDSIEATAEKLRATVKGLERERDTQAKAASERLEALKALEAESTVRLRALEELASQRYKGA